jgi:hypothetical protein
MAVSPTEFDEMIRQSLEVVAPMLALPPVQRVDDDVFRCRHAGAPVEHLHELPPPRKALAIVRIVGPPDKLDVERCDGAPVPVRAASPSRFEGQLRINHEGVPTLLGERPDRQPCSSSIRSASCVARDTP